MSNSFERSVLISFVLLLEIWDLGISFVIIIFALRNS